MALSPADFYAYSRATGAPVPEDAEERAMMAPEVLAYRRNQLRAPQQSEEKGPDALAMGLGIGLGLAGAGGAAFGLRNLLRGSKRSANAGVKQVDLAKEAERETRRAAQKTVPPLPSRVAQEIAEEEFVPYRPDPEEEFVPYRPDPKELISRKVAEARRQTATEDLLKAAKTRRGTYQPEIPGINTTLTALRTPVVDESSGVLEAIAPSRPLSIAPDQPSLFSPRKYIEETGAVAPIASVGERLRKIRVGVQGVPEEYGGSGIGLYIEKLNQDVPFSSPVAQRSLAEAGVTQDEVVQYWTKKMNLVKEEDWDTFPSNSLVDAQQQAVTQVTDQKINAVESGEDQMTGRVRQQLQRNEDLNLNDIDALEDATGSIDFAANQTTDGVPVDQAESVRPLSSQELADIAKQEMIALRQELESRGLRPGTQRFENALAQSWSTKSIPGATPGTQKFRELQSQGKIDIALPTTIRKAVDVVSAGAGPTGMLPERTLINIGPEAQIESTAAGTAIRGASPSLYEVPPRSEVRQLSGTGDPLVPGAPFEVGPDIPGSMRSRGAMSTDIPETQQSKQEIKYSFLNRPPTPELAGGAAGIGVYGIEPAYVPGAMSKSSGQYSAASQRSPSDVPKWIAKQESTPFSNVSTQGLLRAQEKSTRSGATAIQSEINRRERAKESIALSEVMRRARIEGRDPQEFVRRALTGNL